jgi:AcrR family transcriptional regulator
MDVTTPTPSDAEPRPRGRNPRGQGERLRDEVISAATRLLEELADDEALSLRSVARAVGVAAPSVYIHFADRDALVLEVMERVHADLVAAVDAASASSADPAAQLRQQALFHVQWAQRHPGLYKVLHESTLNQRRDMPFKRDLTGRTTAAVQRCIDAGVAPPGDAAIIALDLRVAIYGMASLRVNQPDFPWPDLAEQLERFLTRHVGIAPTTRVSGG